MVVWVAVVALGEAWVVCVVVALVEVSLYGHQVLGVVVVLMVGFLSCGSVVKVVPH